VLHRPSPALVVACLALLLAAGGASFAAVRSTGQAVNVLDPTTGAGALVDATGHLVVGDGAGPLTVDGTVGQRMLSATTPWSAAVATGNSVVPLAGPGGKSQPVSVTSISPAIDTGGTPIAEWKLEAGHVPASATDCSGIVVDSTIWHIRDTNAVQPVVVAFPSPLTFTPPPGTRACLQVNNASTSRTGQFNAGGFFG